MPIIKDYITRDDAYDINEKLCVLRGLLLTLDELVGECSPCAPVSATERKAYAALILIQKAREGLLNLEKLLQETDNE